MTQKLKTPKRVLELLANQQRAVTNTTNMLHVKRTVPLENQARHVRDQSEDRIIGFIEGYNAMLESLLMELNCYAGFYYQYPNGDRLGDINCPDFAEWRRFYHSRT